jgi:outer membrane protein OmpA-like peptidoglycan-associated protein
MNALMSINARILVAIIACFALIPSIVSAQERYVDEQTGQSMLLKYRLGGYLGGGLNLHTANFGALPGYTSCCTTFGNTSALGFAIGALGEIRLSDGLDLDARLGFGTMSASFALQQLIGNEPVLVDGTVGSADRRDVIVEHSLNASIPVVSLEPVLRYQVGTSLWVVGGVRASYSLSPTFEQQETLVTPEGYVFTDGSAIRNKQSGAIPTAAAINLHAAFGAYYELWKSRSYRFGLDARYYYPITKIAEVDWKVHSVHAGLALTFGVYDAIPAIERFDTVYVRDTMSIVTKGITTPSIELAEQRLSQQARRVADTLYTTTTVRESYTKKIPRPFDPGLTVEILGRNSDGVYVETPSLRVEEMDVIESYPILPQIFFAENSADLSSTTQNVLDASSVSTFSSGSLTRNQLSVYNNILNIIGQRMSLQPDAKITIAGYGSNQGVEQNNRELSRARAESVRGYLTSVWGIESQRVVVKAGLLPPQPASSATPDGRAENQRIEIAANDLSILEPVEFRDRDLTYTPKGLVVRPRVAESDEITAWRSSLEQGGRQLAVQNGQGEIAEYSWDPATSLSRPRRDQPLIATYRAANSAGAEVEARDTLAVDYVTLQMIRSRQEEGKQIERYSLIVFDFNSAQLSPANQRTMEKVKARIQSESKVRIVGYADRTGNPEYNRNLARKRCLEAQRVLGVADDRVTIDPVGSDTLIYNNDAPEGRSYSRTVQIEIETPIK